MSIAFYLLVGSEIQWRTVALAMDSSSWEYLAAGFLPSFTNAGGIFIVSCISQHFFSQFFDFITVRIGVMLSFACNILRRPWYKQIPQHEISLYQREMKEDSLKTNKCSISFKSCAIVNASLLTCVGLTIARPKESSLTFLSWTLPLVPILQIFHKTTYLEDVVPRQDYDLFLRLHNATALTDPYFLSWLPKTTQLNGFDDWYGIDTTHYNATADPLKISNLEDELIPGLRSSLKDVEIRHILLVSLESTREDMFPFKKTSPFFDALEPSHQKDPEKGYHRMAHLTPTAQYVTGNYENGIQEETGLRRARGGITFNNAYTTSTYTLKSLTATLCGLYPLVANWNLEVDNHIYQPCLPQILDSFNELSSSISGESEKTSDDFRSQNWTSHFMMPVQGYYDRQNLLMPKLGFDAQRIITENYLLGQEERAPKFGNVSSRYRKYKGSPEAVLNDYIRDAFQTAKVDNERVFLNILTTSTHWPYSTPPHREDYKYVDLRTKSTKQSKNMSKYLNAVGGVDRWIRELLDILEEEEVADKTLVIFLGDHGLSLAETGGISPHQRGHVANFHVPFVLSHPQLPPISVDDPVTSFQLLPTLLDLLLETGSLSSPHRKAAEDLIKLYEGQSLIRPQRAVHPDTGMANWQFSITNPGGTLLAVRDARIPTRRLVIPISGDSEWQLTDLERFPHEKEAISAFGYVEFLQLVKETDSEKTAEWVEEAATVTKWWIGENHRKWRYTA